MTQVGYTTAFINEDKKRMLLYLFIRVLDVKASPVPFFT
jgi:hypothetical protein